jgi:hypothetical protein
MHRIFTFILFLVGLTALAQDSLPNRAVDSLYREDQFYIGVNYNVPLNLPDGGVTSGVTGGVHFGFLRDMPINKQRNLAIAIGAGIALDQFGQNLFIGETTNNESIFRILDENVDYTRNRFNMTTVEVPFEFRWRTSTPESYAFWRVYAGLRVGYAFWYKATFKQSGNNVNQTKIPEFNPLRLSVTLSSGYSNFNFFASYSINTFFNNAKTIDGEIVDFRSLKIGIIFFIL